MVDGIDYYIENGYSVFTEAYHLRRGKCCFSGCRHCPYGFRKANVTDVTQKFGQLALPNAMTMIGYSVAGEETVVQIPEANVCFDIGKCPAFALTSDFVCVSHGHMDHIAGLGYYLSQKNFQGMTPGTVILPHDMVEPVKALMAAFHQLERSLTPFKLVGMKAGDTFQVRRDLFVRSFATTHGRGNTLGYALINIRKKLKPELVGTPEPELIEMVKRGEEIQPRVEVPLVAYMGDTCLCRAFEEPDVINAEVLVTECTFFEADQIESAKAGKHMHVDDFCKVFPMLKNKQIVLTHLTRRTPLWKAKSILRDRLGPAAMERIKFLMDGAVLRDAVG